MRADWPPQRTKIRGHCQNKGAAPPVAETHTKVDRATCGRRRHKKSGNKKIALDARFPFSASLGPLSGNPSPSTLPPSRLSMLTRATRKQPDTATRHRCKKKRTTEEGKKTSSSAKQKMPVRHAGPSPIAVNNQGKQATCNPPSLGIPKCRGP